MAYLKEITRPQCPCGKRAVVILMNYRNASISAYCQPCGKRALKRQNQSEKQDAPRQT